MSNSIYKGEVKKGSNVLATFKSDNTNVDSDLLIMSYAETGGGNPQSAREAVAPAGSAAVNLTVLKEGVLEVWVVTGQAADGGRLAVTRPGKPTHDEQIEGSVRWVYSVV